MFHQILHFLALKEEGNPKFLSEEEIQKVIFDKDYLKFLRKKVRADLSGGGSAVTNKIRDVQYECIKSELKEEYEKKVGVLKNRLNRRALRDPSLLLLQ